MTEQATPRPWQVGPAGVIWSKHPERAIADVRVPKSDSYNPPTNEEAKANGALIVRAVNAYDDMLAALQGEELPALWRISWLENLVSIFKEEHDYSKDEDPSAITECVREVEEMVRLLRAALAKAQGGQA